MRTAPRLQPAPAAVLAKATLRAADRLGLRARELGAVLGVDRTTIGRLRRNPAIEPGTKQGEFAACLVRIYRDLYALFGGDEGAMRHWLNTPNHHLNDAAPRALLESTQGLIRVLEYLDAMRGKV